MSKKRLWIHSVYYDNDNDPICEKSCEKISVSLCLAININNKACYEGMSIAFDISQAIIYDVIFRDGLAEGIKRIYSTDGILREIDVMKNDKKIGKVLFFPLSGITAFRYYETEEFKIFFEYHDNGNIKSVSNKPECDNCILYKEYFSHRNISKMEFERKCLLKFMQCSIYNAFHSSLKLFPSGIVERSITSFKGEEYFRPDGTKEDPLDTTLNTVYLNGRRDAYYERKRCLSAITSLLNKVD